MKKMTKFRFFYKIYAAPLTKSIKFSIFNPPLCATPRILVKAAEVAQLVEQLICNQPVVGSSPIFGWWRFWVDARVVKGDGL